MGLWQEQQEGRKGADSKLCEAKEKVLREYVVTESTGDQDWLLVSDIPQVEWLGMTARYGKRVVEVEENSGIVSFLPMNVEISQVGTGFGVEEETYRKLQYFGHLMQRADSLENTLMLGKIEGRRRRG